MHIPPPQPAQVIRYSYLWADDHARGIEEGRKDRPAAIVLTLKADDKALRVAVVAITHSPPSAGTSAIEIPQQIKRHLNLDDEPSWVILSEINVFNWPGPDLRPASNDDNASVVYGMLPAGFFRKIRDQLVANIRDGKTRQIARSE